MTSTRCGQISLEKQRRRTNDTTAGGEKRGFREQVNDEMGIKKSNRQREEPGDNSLPHKN